MIKRCYAEFVELDFPVVVVAPAFGLIRLVTQTMFHRPGS